MTQFRDMVGGKFDFSNCYVRSRTQRRVPGTRNHQFFPAMDKKHFLSSFSFFNAKRIKIANRQLMIKKVTTRFHTPTPSGKPNPLALKEFVDKRMDGNKGFKMFWTNTFKFYWSDIFGVSFGTTYRI